MPNCGRQLCVIEPSRLSASWIFFLFLAQGQQRIRTHTQNQVVVFFLSLSSSLLVVPELCVRVHWQRPAHLCSVSAAVL